MQWTDEFLGNFKKFKLKLRLAGGGSVFGWSNLKPHLQSCGVAGHGTLF